MKKVLLVVSLVSVLLLAGCNKEEKVNGNVPVVIDNQQQGEVENNFESEQELPESNNVSSMYTEITEQLQPSEAFHVTNVIENGDTYTLQGVIYTHYTLNDSELEKIKNEGSIRLDGKEYTIKEASDSSAVYELYEDNQDFPLYLIKENESIENPGISKYYYLERQTELLMTYKMTDIYKQITVDKNTTCTDVQVGKSVLPDGTKYTAEIEFSEYKGSEATDDTFPLPLYDFRFEDGKCINIEVSRGV